MSYANGTPFLNLAQTVGTDHRDWFDENAAKLNLDTKMKTLWDGAADTAEILASLQESVGSLDTDVTTLEGVVSGHTSTITTINESLVLINTALNALNTQVSNKFDSAGIADPYDATHGIYAIGDVVTYNGQRYVCSTAVTAAEPFDVSKWTAEDVQTVIEQLSGDLANKVISVAGDGVKTYAQILTEIKTVLGSNTLNHNSRIEVTGTNYNSIFECVDSGIGIFSRSVGTVTDARITTINLNITSWINAILNTTSSIVINDISSTVVDSSLTVKLYYV